MNRRRTTTLLLLVALCALPVRTPAQGILDDVRIHGFGGWAVAQSDEGEYLGAAEDREYDQRSFALNVTAQPSDRLSIIAQVFWGPLTNDSESIDTTLDYAFAEWTFSDALALRAGVVKQPFGIYNEIFEVGTVRPFFDLPQSIYGPMELVGKSYQGLGLTGRRTLGDGDWEVQYDLYAGEVDLATFELGFEVEGADELVETGEEKLKDLVGGRLVLHTPVDGLSVGISAYSADPEQEEGEEGGLTGGTVERQETVGGHVEFVGDAWSLRSEVAHRSGGDDGSTLDAYYLEGARRLGAHWQVAARYEKADVDVDGGVILASGSLEDAVLGVNYWFSANLVVKLSYHQPDIGVDVDVADPGAELPPFEALILETPSEIVKLGVQFSF